MPSSKLEIYSFLFVDVARYSKLADREQLTTVNNLQETVENSYLGSSLKDPEKGSLIATGDGLIAAFKDDAVGREPKQVLMLAEQLIREMAPHALRIGLHRGEAESYGDFNARNFYRESQTKNNLAGAGINLTQRVMSLADPGDILASGAFYDHFASKHPGEVDKAFARLGVVRVKHGTEVTIYRRHPAGQQSSIPKKIRVYLTAQNTILELIRRIHQTFEGTVKAEIRPFLKSRVALLPFDHHDKSLYVTEFRFGAGFSEPQTDLRFSLEEGPGRAFKNAIDGGQPTVQYHELPPPPPPDARTKQYLEEFEKATGISAEKVARFQRLSRCYLYYPLFYRSEEMTEPYAVLSIDTMHPVFDRQTIRHHIMTREKQRSKRSADQRIDEAVGRQLDRVIHRVKDRARQIGDAWAVLSQYW